MQQHTHTHTHPFSGPFSGTTRVSRYQKGKTDLDFTEARDSEWQWNQLGRMQVFNSLQTDNHARTPPLSFLQAGCPSCYPTNSVKALKDKSSRNARKTRTKKSIDRAAFTTHKTTCTQTVHTAGRPEDDSWRHRSISSVVSRLRFEVVHRLRRQVANCGRESIAGNIMPHPVTITVRCIRRIEHLITCKRK